MASQIDKDILIEFEELSNYPIRDFFQSFIFFNNNNYSKIIDYFNGDSQIADSQAFNNLKILRLESIKLFEIISQISNRLNNYKWWVLIETVEDIHSKLLSANNASRWLRSAISDVNFDKPETTVILKQNQSIESLTRDTLGFDDWNNEWSNIAIRNQLKEEDYTSEGGNVLKVSFQNNSPFFLQTVVDNIQGDKVYGIDIDKKITFESDDLKVLSPFDTFLQSINILSQLRKGDNTEFTSQGINQKAIIGSNLSLLSYPSIFRQMADVFSTDDTIKSFSIINIKKDDDAIFLTFEVTSKRNDVEQISVPFLS